jgi:hypothetical protein
MKNNNRINLAKSFLREIRESQYANITLSDKLSLRKKKIREYMTDKGVQNKNLAGNSADSMNVADRRRLRLKLRAKAKTGKASMEELNLLRQLNKDKTTRQAGSALVLTSLGMPISALPLTGAGAGLRATTRLGRRSAEHLKEDFNEKKKHKARAIGNREREKQLIQESDSKNKLLKKIKVHLKSNKSANKLGHY